MLSTMKKNGLFVLGLAMLSILVVVTFFGPLFPGVDQELKEINYLWDENGIPVIPPYEPSEEFIFGTDKLGRDLYSLILVGAKETMVLVVAITLIRYLVALPVAYLAHKKVFGFQFFLNWVNVLLSYIPSIIIVILFVNLPPILFADSRPFYMILIIALSEIGRVADSLKSDLDDLANREFMEGGRAVGLNTFRLLRSYYLPFLYNKFFVQMVTDLGKVMFLLGQLGFVGIFVSQTIVQVEIGQFEIWNESISWPMLLMDATKDIYNAIWIPLFPAMAMTYAILTFNILGQGLQTFYRNRNQYV